MPSAATSETQTAQALETQVSPRLLNERARIFSSQAPPGLQTQLDWAEVCLAQGWRDAARLLMETGYLRQGFSRQILAMQASANVRATFWPAMEPGTPSQGESVTEVAIREMGEVAQAVAPHIAPAIVGRRSREETEPSPHLTSISRQASADASEADIGEVVHRVFLAFRAPASLQDWSDLKHLLDTLRGAVQAAAIDHRAFAGASAPLLASALAFSGLTDFFHVNRDLIAGPLGSAELLHHAAHFDSAGLGPYFGNVQQVARRSADVFELADIAAGAAADRGVETGMEPWVALLSRGLNGALLDEVIDDLGDRDARFALGAIYERAIGLPSERIDVSLVMRLRDAALDNLDYDLASRAQRTLVGLRPSEPLELLILGNIDASAGRTGAAEQSFLTCLDQDPENDDLIDRLDAARKRRFTPYAVTKGFGTPADRQSYRLHRRTAAAALS